MKKKLTNKIKESQIQNILSELNTTQWYTKYNNFDVLRFEFKNQRVTEKTGTLLLEEYL